MINTNRIGSRLAAIALYAALSTLAGCRVVERVKYLLPHPVSPARLDYPKRLEKGKILRGGGFLMKKKLLEDARLGIVTDIFRGRVDANPDIDTVIASTNGALLTDSHLSPKSYVPFTAWSSAKVVDVEGDGTCEFMNRGGHGWSAASLIDHRGRTLWTCGRGLPGVDSMAAGHLTKDGLLGFVVGFNGDGGVVMLNGKGKRKWREQDGDVWHVEIADADGRGYPEVVHSSTFGEFTVRDANGYVLLKVPDMNLNEFALTRWPTRQAEQCVVSYQRDTIKILSLGAKTLATLQAPQCDTVIACVEAALVRLEDQRGEYLAVVVEVSSYYPPSLKSVLYVYSPAKELVYAEVLPESCRAITALALNGSKTESLLVGGERRIWQYDIAKPSAAAPKAPKKH